jgi:hypothetical protein
MGLQGHLTLLKGLNLQPFLLAKPEFFSEIAVGIEKSEYFCPGAGIFAPQSD